MCRHRERLEAFWPTRSKKQAEHGRREQPCRFRRGLFSGWSGYDSPFTSSIWIPGRYSLALSARTFWSFSTMFRMRKAASRMDCTSWRTSCSRDGSPASFSAASRRLVRGLLISCATVAASLRIEASSRSAFGEDPLEALGRPRQTAGLLFTVFPSPALV